MIMNDLQKYNDDLFARISQLIEQARQQYRK